MMFPDSKNVTFVEILLRPNSSTKSSGLPDFYSVKLDVIGFQPKLHFWNRETSYINALYSESIPNYLETYQSFKDAVSMEFHDFGVILKLSLSLEIPRGPRRRSSRGS